MKKIFYLFFLLCFFSTALFASDNSPEKLWVSSEGAKLKANKKASSSTIAKLIIGTELAVLQYEKKWYRVTLSDGKTGWIYRGKVSKNPVEKKEGSEEGGSFGNLLGDLTGSSIRADNTDSSRSIRGLSPEATEYAKQQGTPEKYRKELDKVVAEKTTPSEIENFLKQGKIGEYQE